MPLGKWRRSFGRPQHTCSTLGAFQKFPPPAQPFSAACPRRSSATLDGLTVRCVRCYNGVATEHRCHFVWLIKRVKSQQLPANQRFTWTKLLQRTLPVKQCYHVYCQHVTTPDATSRRPLDPALPPLSTPQDCTLGLSASIRRPAAGTRFGSRLGSFRGGSASSA